MKKKLKHTPRSLKARKSKVGKSPLAKWSGEMSKKWIDSVELVADGGPPPGYIYSNFTPTISTTSGSGGLGGILTRIWRWIWDQFGENSLPQYKNLLDTSTSPKMLALEPTIHAWALPQLFSNKQGGGISNVSGLWEIGTANTKVTADGAAGSMICLTSGLNNHLMCALVKTHPNVMTAMIIHASREGTRATDLFQLAKADSYCIEADIDVKTGQTTVWINDTGVDLGILNGFKGGASSATLAVAASNPMVHLPAGRFTNCAVAMNGKWEKANFTYNMQHGNLAPHHEVKILAADSVSSLDLRSKVV